MTDTTIKSFAYRLFHAIRGNKKALIALLPPYRPNSPDHLQHQKLRHLIDAMFEFEKYARGSQKALAGVHQLNHFTVKAGSSARQQGCFQEFTRNAVYLAHRVVELMLDCQSLLTGPTWQAMVSIEGMSNDGFRTVVRPFIGLARLPQLVKTFQDFSAHYDTSTLKMEFKNGAALNKRELAFPIPNAEGKTLEQQIVQMNQFWMEMKHVVRDAAKDPKNWPTLHDSRNVELETIKDMLAGFHRNLRPEQRELLRKHPQEVSRFFNNQM